MYTLKELSIKERCLELLDEAREKYGNLGEVDILFYPHSASYALAGIKNKRYYIKFSQEAIEKDAADAYTDTIPHEIAHLVAHFLTGKMNHSKVWKRICIALGGSGKRCSNSVKLTPKRLHKYYKYVLPSGRVTWLSKTMHTRLQQRMIGKKIYFYRTKDTNESIKPSHFTGFIGTRLDF